MNRPLRVAESPDVMEKKMMATSREVGEFPLLTIPTEIFDEICNYLHHTDLVNLSLTSQACRRKICRSLDMTQEGDMHLRRRTCWGDKSDCWTCGVQICLGCTIYAQLQDTEPSWHKEHCRAICTPCYTKRLRGLSKKGNPRKNIVCGCVNCPPVIHLYPTGRPPVVRPTCLECQYLTTQSMTDIRRYRDKETLHDLSAPTYFCNECHKSLQPGPRWWLCTKCKRECTDYIHPQWVITDAVDVPATNDAVSEV